MKIHTQYKPYPGSNVGQYVARYGDRRARLRVDQAVSNDENHRRVAQVLAERVGITLGQEVWSSDDGQRRTFGPPKTLADLEAEVREDMSEKYDLVYVSYDDQLTNEQVAALVRHDPDWLQANPYLDEWEGEQRATASHDIAKDLGNTVLDRWIRAGEDEEHVEDLRTEWEDSSEFEEVTYTIQERDDSDWPKQLAGHNGHVLLRINFMDEDTAIRRNKPKKALKAARLPRTPENVDKMRSILNEVLWGENAAMGYYIVAVRVGDIYDMPWDTEQVAITNPFVYFGNPLMGDGYCDGPIEGTVIVPRDELRTDKDAFGYGWDEIAGVVVSAYEAEIRAIPNEESTSSEWCVLVRDGTDTDGTKWDRCVVHNRLTCAYVCEGYTAPAYVEGQGR